MKILVIFTGGTIGSRMKNGWFSTDNNTNYTLLEPFKDAEDIEFDTASPFTILSENLSANELNLLQKEVAVALGKNYDGIIITHGTDTLQYAACAIENAFGKCSVPVIFVSAAYPLEDARTNGFDNFRAALEFIKGKVENGVFVSYKNEKDSFISIHKASSLLQHSEGSSDLYSIDGTAFAAYDGKNFTKSNICEKKCRSLGVVEYANDPGILLIESHPADSFSYSLCGIKAVIIKPYHSATLCTANPRLESFCEKARSEKIPVFVSGVKDGTSYESTSLFGNLGITPLPYGTLISAYMKLWAGISQGEDLLKFTK